MTLGALLAGLRHGNRLAAFDMRRGSGHGVKAVVDLPPNQVGQHRARALIRHMESINFGGQFEHFQRQVLRRSVAGRAKADLAGVLAAQFHHVLDSARRLLSVADQQVRRDADQHDRGEVIFNAAGHLRRQRRGDADG